MAGIEAKLMKNHTSGFRKICDPGSVGNRTCKCSPRSTTETTDMDALAPDYCSVRRIDYQKLANNFSRNKNSPDATNKQPRSSGFLAARFLHDCGIGIGHRSLRRTLDRQTLAPTCSSGAFWLRIHGGNPDPSGLAANRNKPHFPRVPKRSFTPVHGGAPQDINCSNPNRTIGQLEGKPLPARSVRVTTVMRFIIQHDARRDSKPHFEFAKYVKSGAVLGSPMKPHSANGPD